MEKKVCTKCSQVIDSKLYYCSNCNSYYDYNCIKLGTRCPDCSNKLKTIVEKKDETPTLLESKNRKDSDKNNHQVDNTEFNYKFKTLLKFGNYTSIIGWIFLGLSVLLFLIGLTITKPYGYIIAGSSLFIVLPAISLVLFGELISCFVNIEKNTRTTYEILSDSKKG